MKIPLNWLADYVKLPTSKTTLVDKLTMAGHMLDKIEKVNGEVVVDLELRGNRADCYSILGIAREVSALFNSKITEPKSHKPLKISPREVQITPKTKNLTRVMAVVIRDVKILPSPTWLKKRLEAYGIETINNIVDLTNFVMVEIGEPMHAFDLDKVSSQIEIRMAREGEGVTTFQGEKLVLTKEDLVWATKDAVISVAGAIGGKNHSISKATKNILLEAASYERANIRRTIHRHNLFTDAGIRHEKDLDPNLVETAIYRFLYLLEKNKWGKIPTQVFDYYPKPATPQKVYLSFKKLKNLSGVAIDKLAVRKILKLLNFQTLKETPTGLEVLVPTYRTDVATEEDLIEEIVRIYGYDKIPSRTLSLEIPNSITPNYIIQELDIKAKLFSLGFDEIISIPFVKEKYANYNFSSRTNASIKIVNPPSPDIRILRTSLLPSLLASMEKIIHERGEIAQLYEIGKVYFKKNTYQESRKLGILFWNTAGTDYSHFKGYLEALTDMLNLPSVSCDDPQTPVPGFTQHFDLLLEKNPIGWGGRIKGAFFAEIDLDLILGTSSPVSARLWPKYPPQIEDLTLTLPPNSRVGKVAGDMRRNKFVVKVELRDIFNYAYTFRIWYQSKTKTLTNQEVDKIRERVIKRVKEKFAAAVTK